MLKYATEGNIPHKSSVVKTKHDTVQKQRGVGGRVPQRRGHDVMSVAKKNPVRRAKQQTDDKLDDRNVVNISDLRRILRLAEPAAAIENDVTFKSSTQETRHEETAVARTRMIPTSRVSTEVHVTGKAPDGSRKQGESSGQLINKSPTTLTSDGIFFPFGSPGGGAPIRTKSGRLNVNYRERDISSQKSFDDATTDNVKQQTVPSSDQRNVELKDYHSGQQQSIVVPVPVPVRQHGRALPHAMRSSFAFGTAYGADDDSALRDKQRWLDELRQQMEEKKARDAASELRQRVIDERDTLRDSRYQTWQTHTVPAVSQAVTVAQVHPSGTQLLAPPPVIQTESPEKPLTNMSMKSGEERSYHRQHRLLLDPSVLSDMEQRHQKDTEHQRFIKQQLEEKLRVKREREERLAREVAMDEARLEKEREQLRLQYEKEQESAREKEEAARRRREHLEEQIRQAHEAAIQEKHAKVRRHVGRVSPLEIIPGETSRRDEELPSSRKVLTLSASRHVFTEKVDTQPDNVPRHVASPVDSAVDHWDAMSSLSVNEMYEVPSERIEDRTVNNLQRSSVMKTKVKQQSTSGDVQKVTAQTGRKTRRKTQQHEEQQARPTHNVKANLANNRYRQRQSVIERGNAIRGNKRNGLLQRHTTGAAPPNPVAKNWSHDDQSSQVPVTARQFARVLLGEHDIVAGGAIGLETERALPVMGAPSHRAATMTKPAKPPGQTHKKQAGGRNLKRQEERNAQDRVSGGTFTVEKDRRERKHSLLPVPLTKQRCERDSPIFTYVVDGPPESDDNESEACSLPSTGDAYRVPIRRTSATLPSIVQSTSIRPVNKQAGQESEKLQSVLARITTAGGTESQLYFHDKRGDDDAQKEEQQTVRPHPLQLPSTTSQVLRETKKYLESRRQHQHQRQWQQDNDFAPISSRQEEILSHLALLRQGLFNKQKQTRLH